MAGKASLPPTYFEDMYAGTADPWGFETSAYEQAKYDRTIAALGGRRYARAFEIGCANGVLTRRLADHANDLLAVDVSPTALGRAAERCADCGHVRFERISFPAGAPADTGFDLVVCSEVAYYWDDADLSRAGAWLGKAIASGGDLLLVHWTGETDYPQTADAAVEKLRRPLDDLVDVRTTEREPKYRLDLWRRR